ncbi:hypothetical protein, partial [Stenotrophomonas pavanii]|uniref:hypothetical protein n=1 Tax=Stenotrophomonas pavanii TaxID=487698 RepID=UPI0039C664CF
LLPINTSVIAINYGNRMSTKGWPVHAELGDGLTFHDFHGGPSNHKEVCMGGAHMIAAPYATTSDLANI